MQSYCIYAEAFAGPFQPLRAPEPPFTHKTPPFTQVLFLFDAFYGTISLRKSSSLCSYKTESEAPMKKRILALLLAFSMMLSLLPVSALADTGGGIDFAAYASNGLIGQMPDLRMNSNGKPNKTLDSNGFCQGDGWTYQVTYGRDTLTLKSGKYDFNYTFPGFSDSKHFDDCDHLSRVTVNNIVVEEGATIVGGVFEEKSLVNHGTVTNGLFSGTAVTNDGKLNCLFRPAPSKPKPVGIECHSLTAADNSTVEVLLYSFGNTTTTYRGGTFYFTGTPKLTVKLDDSTIHYINGEEHYGGLTSPDGKGYQTFTPQAGEDIVLNRKPYATDLVMTPRGFPETTGREPIYDTDGKTIIGCKGNGWKYENGTLTLESGEYDFTYTKPRDTTSTRHSNHVRCNVIVNKGAAITGGILNGNSLTNSGTVKDVLIMGGQITNNGKLSCLLDQSVDDGSGFTRRTMTAVDGSQIYYTVNQQSTGNGKQLYFTGTPKFTVKLEKSDIRCINGDKNYGGLRPSVVHGYYTFTPEQEEDIVLNREPYVTDLVMTTDGIPDITNVAGGKDGTHFSYKGDGWTFTRAADISDAIGTLTLKNTNSYDFCHLDPLKGTGGELAAVKCLLMNDGATIENGVFKNLVINHSGTISGGTFAVGLFSIDSEDFVTSGTVTGGAFNGKDGLSDGAHAVTVKGGSILKVNDTEPLKANEINDGYDLRYDIVPSAEWNLYSYEGTIVTVTADTEITNINGWDIGKFPGGSSYPNGEDDKTTVSFRMPDGPVVLNDTLYTLDIIRGTMLGNTSVSVPAGTELILKADEPAKNETFLGWTLSDESLLKDGKLNDPNYKTITIKMNNASATAEAVFQKDTPAYTLTVTGGGLVNGKTSAVVEAGDEVRLTVGEMQEGMSFNYWDLPTALTKALTAEDFSNKVEPLTFTMPDLSGYTEDKSFTIRMDIRPAELPDDDDGPSVLGTMATVAVGGAAAGILVWQGVSLGVDSYLQLSLPGGVPVPANRIELVKLLWETAGKPDVVLPALYGDVSTEDAELQKATRWAIDNGLVKPADETDASRFDPDRSVSKYEVARAWFKVQQMLK